MPAPFFPIPESGETVFSLVSRYARRSGLPHGWVLRALTGRRAHSQLFGTLPGAIPNLAGEMPFGHPWRDPMYIVNHHTGLPYFTYFCGEATRRRAVESLASQADTRGLRMSLGLVQYPQNTMVRHPRYCPECVRSDYERLGYTCFRRIHQLPAVLVCPLHQRVLVHGCRRCGTYPTKGRVLSMAGRCRCEEIDPLPVVQVRSDQIEPLHWLAVQSGVLVESSGTLNENCRARLRHRALEIGYHAKNRGINSNALAKAVVRRFGADLLQQLGIVVETSSGAAPWIRRLPCPQLHGEKKSPTLRFLLMIGALFESIVDFESWTTTKDGAHSDAKTNQTGFPASKADFRAVIPATDTWRANLRVLLEKAQFCIWRAAQVAGVYSHRIASEARRQGIMIPLSPVTMARLGEGRLRAIREALRAGMYKTEIQEKLKCSEWTLLLVELDDPSLSKEHAQSARRIVRDRNRKRLLSYLERNRMANRSSVQDEFVGVYEFLMRFDREWFDQHLPARKTRVYKIRKIRKDWAGIDEKYAQLVNASFDLIFASVSKPIRATATRVLKEVGILPRYYQNRGRLPSTKKALMERAETREVFVKRRISWAVGRMAYSGTPISMNKLRRVADIGQTVIMEQADWVRTAVCISGATFHPECSLGNVRR